MTTRQRPQVLTWWPWAAALMLVAFSYYPTLVWLITSWLGNSYYSHGFLVPLVSLVLAWRLQRRRASESSALVVSGRSFAAGLALAGLGLGMHILALTRQLYLISAASLILVLSGTVLALAGADTLRRQAFPLGFLLLMIPLPYLEKTTPYLARWVASAAATVTRAAGLEVIVSGARVELPETTLVIGAPCSGVNSLAALTTLAVLYAFLVRGPLVARLALVILALPIALLANLVRVCLLVLLAHYFGEAAAMRYFHNWSSPFLFVLALGMLIIMGKWLRCGEIRSDI